MFLLLILLINKINKREETYTACFSEVTMLWKRIPAVCSNTLPLSHSSLALIPSCSTIFNIFNERNKYNKLNK